MIASSGGVILTPKSSVALACGNTFLPVSISVSTNLSFSPVIRSGLTEVYTMHYAIYVIISRNWLNTMKNIMLTSTVFSQTPAGMLPMWATKTRLGRRF